MRLLRDSRIQLAVTVSVLIISLTSAQEQPGAAQQPQPQPQQQQPEQQQRQPQQGGNSAFGGLLSGMMYRSVWSSFFTLRQSVQHILIDKYFPNKGL